MPGFRQGPQHEAADPPWVVRLLIDNGLSHKLPSRLQDIFPGSAHVSTPPLSRTSSDIEIYRHAKAHGLTILTKDADFDRIARQLGPLPKIIRVALGNCTTDEVFMRLQEQQQQITAFVLDSPGLVFNLS